MSKRIPNYRNFVYNEDHKFVFAYVPKIACTNWRALLRKLAGHKDWLDISIIQKNVNADLNVIDPDAGGAAILGDSRVRKFTMVRDPYSRALSAYLNKVESRLPPPPEADGEDHFNKVIRSIDAFRRAELGDQRFPEVTFEVFLRWMRDSGDLFTNDWHWAPQGDILRFPRVEFDIVGRFENLPDDGNKILEAMGCDIPFPTQKDVNFAPTNAQSKLVRYYTSTNRTLVQEIYRKDFDAFGYPQ